MHVACSMFRCFSKFRCASQPTAARIFPFGDASLEPNVVLRARRWQLTMRIDEPARSVTNSAASAVSG
jgi:hypothetical protein